MEVIIVPNAQRVGEVAAAKAARIAAPIGPKIVLGVATGTPTLITAITPTGTTPPTVTASGTPVAN